MNADQRNLLARAVDRLDDGRDLGFSRRPAGVVRGPAVKRGGESDQIALSSAAVSTP